MKSKKFKIKYEYIVYIGGVPHYFNSAKEQQKFYDSYKGIHIKTEDLSEERNRSNYGLCIWIRTIKSWYEKRKFLFWEYEKFFSEIIR